MKNNKHQTLLIVDFGSQVTKLIARRLREKKIYCEIHPYQKISKSFLRTLSDGILRLDTITKDSKSTKVSGKLVFELYDTYGFPSDLTSLILREKNITYDHNEYTLELEKQKSRSRL